MIYHICTKTLWQLALDKNIYECDSLFSEGFIHCCHANQIEGVLHRYYKNSKDLLLLHLNINEENEILKFELSPSINEYFPHIYGGIALDFVVEIIEIDDLNNWKKSLE